jgi:hypothetical protein
MVKQHQVKHWTVRLGIVCLVLSSLLTAQENSWASKRIRFNPPKGGAPKETKGGASRSDITCTTNPGRDKPQIVLLTPGDSNFGLTTQEHPIFMVYVPPSSAKQAFFSLKDGNGKSHYQQKLVVPSQGGILRIALPTSATPLTLKQSYQWGVVLLCGGKLRADSPFASGWIQRIQLTPKITRTLANQMGLDQVALYGESGIWYDMLSNLAILKQQKPQDKTINQTWNQILSSVGLESVNSAAIVD